MQKTQQSSQPHSLRGVYGCNNRGTENWSTKSSYRDFIFMDGINFYHLNSEELAHGLTRVQFVRKLCSFKVVKRISHIPNDDRHGCPCTARTDVDSSRSAGTGFKVVKRISHIPNDDRHGCPCTARTDVDSSRSAGTGFENSSSYTKEEVEMAFREWSRMRKPRFCHGGVCKLVPTYCGIVLKHKNNISVKYIN